MIRYLFLFFISRMKLKNEVLLNVSTATSKKIVTQRENNLIMQCFHLDIF